MEKEILLEGAEFVKRDMFYTADSLDYIADQILYCEIQNREWMEDLCYAMIKERTQHVRERATELFADLHIYMKEDKTSVSKQIKDEEG